MRYRKSLPLKVTNSTIEKVFRCDLFLKSFFLVNGAKKYNTYLLKYSNRFRQGSYTLYSFHRSIADFYCLF